MKYTGVEEWLITELQRMRKEGANVAFLGFGKSSQICGT